MRHKKECVANIQFLHHLSKSLLVNLGSKMMQKFAVPGAGKENPFVREEKIKSFKLA